MITIPAGFVGDAQGARRQPAPALETGTGGITPRVRQQMQALVYNLNLKLQKAFIAADIQYVSLLLHGGKGRVLGHDVLDHRPRRDEGLLARCRRARRGADRATSSTTRGSRSR